MHCNSNNNHDGSKIRTILWVLGLKIIALLLLIIVIAYTQFPQYNMVHKKDQGWYEYILNKLGYWDFYAYKQIAKSGYQQNSSICAFYPLWPALIRLGAYILKIKYNTAAIYISNLLSVLFLYNLGCYLLKYVSWRNVKISLVIIVMSPVGIFLSLPYTESMYLYLAILCLMYMDSNRVAALAMILFMIPLVRPVGIFIIVPLCYYIIQQQRWRVSRYLIYAILTGYICYFGIMYLETEDALSGFKAQKHYPNKPSIANIYNINDFTHAFTNIGSYDKMLDAALDRIMFIIIIISLPILYRFNKLWFYYTLPLAIIPAFTNYFLSYRRFALPCFLLIPVLILYLDSKYSKSLKYYYVSISIISYIYVAWQMSHNKWIG